MRVVCNHCKKQSEIVFSAVNIPLNDGPDRINLRTCYATHENYQGDGEVLEELVVEALIFRCIFCGANEIIDSE